MRLLITRNDFDWYELITGTMKRNFRYITLYQTDLGEIPRLSKEFP